LSHVTRHTSHVTRHTSHVTRHTSHVTRHTSHVTRHTSHFTRHTSHVTRHTSHVTRHTSHVTHHPSLRVFSFTWELLPPNPALDIQYSWMCLTVQMPVRLASINFGNASASYPPPNNHPGQPSHATRHITERPPLQPRSWPRQSQPAAHGHHSAKQRRRRRQQQRQQRQQQHWKARARTCTT
jgi:hypothetical protein